MSSQFEGQRAYRHIEALSVEIGPRVSGTEAEKQAADYVAGQLAQFGLEPVVLAFPMANEQALDCSFKVLEPELLEIETRPLVGSPDTPQEGLSGELVFVEHAREPYTGPHIKGKIVLLANGGLLGRGLADLLKYEPLGLILVRQTLGSEPNTFHVIRKQANRPYALIPTVHISYEDALRLWNMPARQVQMRLQTRCSQGQSFAVYAEVTGSTNPDEIIVIGGHMDTVPQDPGATDNAAGVATVLELARVFAQRGSRRTLRFAAWGSEEGSGGGSLKYVLELKKKHKQQKESEEHIEGIHKTDLEKHLLNVNLDVLGMSLGRNAFYNQGPQALGEYVKALTCELGIHHDLKTEIYGSDNISFGWAGIPAISFAREGVAAQYMHTSRDDISLIDAGQLEGIGRLLEVFLMRTAAEGQIWPFERQVTQFTPERLEAIKTALGEVIELMGEDPGLMDEPR